MDSNSYQSLEEAYQSILDSQQDVENLDESINGASLSFRAPLGRGVNRTSGVGAGVQGGSGTTKGSANAAITRTTDRVQATPAKTAVDNALSNLNTGAAIPKTKQLPDKIGGSVNANLSGGSAPKPKPKPAAPVAAKPKSKPKPTVKTQNPTPTTPRDPRVQNPAASSEPRVQNPAAPTPRSGAAALGGGMSIARGDGGRGRLSMDTMSDVDTYNLVLEYLLDEGFASTEQSADKIILNMSEAWFEDIVELYKGKHGQSEKEYMDSRSDAGKQISGDSKMSGAAYSHRSFKGQGKPAKPGERQTHQGKMTNADRTELMIRKNALRKDAEAKALKKEELELDENRRAARSAGGYKDDSKKQPDPSKDGFTGVGNMSIKDIMALNKKIEDRKAKKEETQVEGEQIDEGREEDAKKSLDAVKKRQGVLDDHEKKTGKKLDITKTPEYKSHKQNFPGAKRTDKKEKGAKETDLEKHNRRVQTYIDRLKKYGKTKKQKRDDEAMAKHTSPRD